MHTLRTITMAAVLAGALGACAQMPGSSAAPPPANAERMAAMDAQMKSMREMHEKMARARTPEERQALMAEHAKLMREGMAMMDGMHGRMGTGMGMGMGNMGSMAGAASAPADMPARMQMMEKHMEMMNAMMQMMMDQAGPPPAR